MKKFLAITLLAATALLGAQEIPKLAIVGGQNLADLLHAELAGSPEFELYEREQVRKVLVEHRLSALSAGALVKLFPHVDCFAVLEPLDETPTRLIVFDARSGYRKADAMLPERLEDAVKRAAETIRRTMKLASRERITIGFSSLRDSGVPVRFNKINDFAAAFEQLAGKDEAVILLERARLGYVVGERALSETAFPLAPSAKLIRLEFTPGPRPEIVHCTVRITNSEGAVLSKQEFKDVFSDLPQSSGEVFRAVKQYTVQSPAPVEVRGYSNSVEEAARFFAEFKAAGNGKDAEAKLMAARALAPQNREYINAEIFLKFGKISRIRKSPERLAAWREALDCAKRLDLAPSLPAVPSTEIIYDYRWYELNSNEWRKSLPSGEREEAEKIASEYRTLLDEAFRKKDRPKHFSDYWALYYHMQLIQSIYGNPILHLSQESYRKSSAVEIELLFDAIETYINASPETRSQDFNLYEGVFRYLNNDNRWKFDQESFLRYIERAERSPALPLQSLAIQWRFLKELREADDDDRTEDFDGIVKNYYARCMALYGKHLQPLSSPRYLKLKTISDRELGQLFQKHRPPPEKKR